MRSRAPAEPSDFQGVWQIDRRITDALGRDASMKGRAEISTLSGNIWHYREDGLLQLGGAAPLLATRSYHWTPDRDGRAIRISFTDGRMFHDMPLAGGSAHHDCPPDIYRCDYDFSDWPVWRAVWRVNGPRKDYVSDTTYAPETLRTTADQA